MNDKVVYIGKKGRKTASDDKHRPKAKTIESP